MYTVYILRTSKNTLYTGITNNLNKRLADHMSKGKRASKYMRSFESFSLIHTEKLETRSLALKRESEIKKLTRQEKEILIKQ